MQERDSVLEMTQFTGFRRERIPNINEKVRSARKSHRITYKHGPYKHHNLEEHCADKLGRKTANLRGFSTLPGERKIGFF